MQRLTFLLVVNLMIISTVACEAIPIEKEEVKEVVYDTFSGERAWQDVDYQVALGARTPGSQAHAQTIGWIEEHLRGWNWEVEIQEVQVPVGNYFRTVRNVIAKYGSGEPWLVLGAHYDSRLVADRDPNNVLRNRPVPGANDGASGVAVLLELGRILPDYFRYPTPGHELSAQQIWLVFFDAEDNGQIEGWDWILGSRAFVNSLDNKPNSAIIIDMIGDANQNIYYEKNSDKIIRTEIWETAAQLGYTQWFIAEEKYSILDDHTPFLEARIPAVDIIDFDYTYWHTTADTADKVSAESLQRVGDTLLKWLLKPAPGNAQN